MPREALDDEEQKLRDWISEFHQIKHFPTTDSYDNQFSIRPDKAALAIKHFADKHVDPQTAVCVSIGGADGSDVIELMRKTGVQHGVLLEFSPVQAQRARKAAKSLLKGRSFLVLEGDAFAQLSPCRAHLDRLQKDHGVITIVTLAMAVLHELELRRRSPRMDYDVFFGTLFKDFENRFLYSREPCAPDGWPTTVQFRIGKSGDYAFYNPSLVAEFARLIAIAHRKDPEKVFHVADGFVHASAPIAAETIRRVLYVTSEQDLRYELDEFHSAYKVEALEQRLKKYFLDGTTQVYPTNSDTMRALYAKHRVEARDAKSSRSLGMPSLFKELICEQIRISTEITPEKLKLWISENQALLSPLWDAGYSVFGSFEVPVGIDGPDWGVRESNYAGGIRRMFGGSRQQYSESESCVVIARILKRNGVFDLREMPKVLLAVRKNAKANLKKFKKRVDWFTPWPVDSVAVCIGMYFRSLADKIEDEDLFPFRRQVRAGILGV